MIDYGARILAIAEGITASSGGWMSVSVLISDTVYGELNNRFIRGVISAEKWGFIEGALGLGAITRVPDTNNLALRDSIFAQMPYHGSNNMAKFARSRNDAMIGATSIMEGATLVTGDRRLREAVINHHGTAVDPSDILGGVW